MKNLRRSRAWAYRWKVKFARCQNVRQKENQTWIRKCWTDLHPPIELAGKNCEQPTLGDGQWSVKSREIHHSSFKKFSHYRELQWMLGRDHALCILYNHHMIWFAFVLRVYTGCRVTVPRGKNSKSYSPVSRVVWFYNGSRDYLICASSIKLTGLKKNCSKEGGRGLS